MVAAAEAQFPPKVESAERASRAEPPQDLASTAKRGRKTVVTPERVEKICEALAEGESETAACLRVGIGLTAWSTAKRRNSDFRRRIASARDDWARLRHARHAAALYESQWNRSAARKAKRPQPTYQANLVMWHLTTRIPLNFAAIPETEMSTVGQKLMYNKNSRSEGGDCSKNRHKTTRSERHCRSTLGGGRNARLDCSGKCMRNVRLFEASSQRLSPPHRNSFKIGRQTTTNISRDPFPLRSGISLSYLWWLSSNYSRVFLECQGPRQSNASVLNH